MVLQSVRGIPVPESTDPANPPADLARIVQALDPGALVPYDPTATQLGYRIVFLLQGDDDPNTLSIPPILGTIYFDRERARLWVPFTQLVNGVSTLGWYRIGADADAEIATLQGNQVGLVKSDDQITKSQHVGQATVVLSNFPAGVGTQAWQSGITFPSPFNNVPIVIVCNGDTVGEPNVTLGVQNVTTSGFQVQVTRSDVAFHLGDQVLVNYIAVASA